MNKNQTNRIGKDLVYKLKMVKRWRKWKNLLPQVVEVEHLYEEFLGAFLLKYDLVLEFLLNYCITFQSSFLL